MTTSEQLRLVMHLSPPAVMSQITSVIMQYIDAAMVGQLGAVKSASIGLVSTSTWLFGGLCMVTATGFSVQVAQLVGAGKESEARDVLRQAIMAGAALGTALAQGITAVFMVKALLFHSAVLRLQKGDKCRMEKNRIGKAVWIAVPVGLEHILMNGAMIITTRIVAPLGMVAIAANSFAVTAESLYYMPGYGIADAATTLVG